MSFKDEVMSAKYIKVSAPVRYWDDADINGDRSEGGELVPFKSGDNWEPVIDIENGIVLNWPSGISADFHFKVCDAGSYFLLNDDMNEVASILENYVPDGLCHGDSGYGDYIIFKVGHDGEIFNYKKEINPSDWADE